LSMEVPPSCFFASGNRQGLLTVRCAPNSILQKDGTFWPYYLLQANPRD
jgi:hypothetical protein